MVTLRPETTISGRRIQVLTHRSRARLAAVGVVLALMVQPGAALETEHTSVKSKIGERLDATITVVLAPGEHLDANCLSLARDQDLAESGHLLITDAALSLYSGNGPIRIISASPVTQSAITLALRAQCSDGPPVVRTINLYLNAATPVISGFARPGSTFTVRPGDSIYKLARLIYPHNETAVHNLARAIVLANPALFPDGRARPLQVGERLIIPDLRTVSQIIAAATTQTGTRDKASGQDQAAPAAQSGTTAHRGTSRKGNQARQSDKTRATEQASGYRISGSGKLNLKLSTDLAVGNARPKSGTSKAARAPSPAAVAPAGAASSSVKLQLSMIASRIDRLRLAQDKLDARLDRLEIEAAALQKVFAQKAASQRVRPSAATQPAVSQTAPPSPPQTAVNNRRSFMPQSQWLVFGGVAIVLLLAGLMLIRLFRNRRNMRQHRQRIDAMLEEARTAATPLLDKEPRMPARDVEPAFAPGNTDHEAESEPDGASELAMYPDIADEDMRAVEEVESVQNPWRGAEMTDSGLSPERSDADEVPAWLRIEMDRAMDSTRSMFSDVDRFITLGRIENAISLLEFQIKRNPADRNAWIKLMAIYRDRGLDDNFGRTYAAFREQFGSKPGY